MKSLYAWMLILTGLLPLPAEAAAPSTDTTYLQAFEAARQHRERQYLQARNRYGDGPLLAYLDFAWLYYNLDRATQGDVARFLQQHARLPVRQLLLDRWLRHLGRHRQWDAFLQHWSPSKQTDLRCLYLRARQAVQPLPEADFRQALRELWLHPRSLPRTCDPLLHSLRNRGWLDQPLIWQRFSLAMQAGQWQLARWLAGQLKRPDLARDWLRVRGNLNRLVRAARRWPDTPQVHILLAHELRRLAVSRPEAVRQALLGPLSRFSLPADQRHALLARTALFAATDGLPQAAHWLDQALRQRNDVQLRLWAVRDALRREDWNAVLRHIDQLPAEKAADNQWQYWKARALAASGFKKASDRLMQSLAARSTYYGFLAADRLQQRYSICPQTSGLVLPVMNRLLDEPALQRALALERAGQWHYARLELNALIRTLDAQQRKQLGLILSDQRWHAPAIRLLADHPRLYRQRFPLEHQAQIRAAARKDRLPEPLILALIRAESAFSPRARSSAGARGLMQIMPAVGRKLARQFGIQPWHTALLDKPEINIPMGSRHLHHYLHRFAGHPIPALAAYNAGPDRVSRWLDLPQAVSDTLIWLELLPYGETRQYVRKLLAYRVIYQWRLHQRVSRISDWLLPLDRPFPARRLMQPATMVPGCSVRQGNDA